MRPRAPERNTFGLFLLVLALSLVLARSSAAHDIWLHADKFSLEKGDTLVIRQLVGTVLSRDFSRPGKLRELPVLRALTPRFALITENDSIDLLAELPDMRTRPNIKPVLTRRLELEGLVLVTMEHSIIYTEHTTDEFFDYLEHEGFARQEFESKMAPGPVQTEGYQRTLKILVRVGEPEEAPQGVQSRVVGQSLELLLRQNPYRLDAGDDLDVQVLFRGEPLPDKLVQAYNAAAGSVSKQQARTGPDGIARFNLDRAGSWLVRLVHLVPCSELSAVDCEDAAWESYWAAYSFELD